MQQINNSNKEFLKTLFFNLNKFVFQQFLKLGLSNKNLLLGKSCHE